MRRSAAESFALVIAGLALAALFYVPLAGFLSGLSLPKAGGTGLAALATDPYYVRIVAFTVVQALASALLSLLLGLPGAYILSHYDFRGKRLLAALTVVPFMFPSILVVLGFVLFFGNSGILNTAIQGLFGLTDPPLHILYSFTAIILAHAFYNFPVVVRTVAPAWERIPAQYADAARTLGARPARVFRTVILPELAVPLLSSLCLIFLFCSLSFSVVLVLGGGPAVTTTEVEVYRSARIDFDLDSTRAFAIAEALINVLVLGCYFLLQKKPAAVREGSIAAGHTLPARPRTRAGRLSLAAYAAVIAVIVGGPCISIVAYSFLRRSGQFGALVPTLDWYRRMVLPGSGDPFSRVALPSLLATAWVGAAAATLAVALGALFAVAMRRDSLLSLLLLLPIGTSSITLTLAFQTTYPALAGSGWAIVVLQAVCFFPFAYSSLRSVRQRIPRSLYEAARLLGARPSRARRDVNLPLLGGAAAASWAFCFALSAGDLNVIAAFGVPGLTTAPLAMYRLIGSYNFFAASALGVALALVSCVLFYLADALTGDHRHVL